MDLEERRNVQDLIDIYKCIGELFAGDIPESWRNWDV